MELSATNRDEIEAINQLIAESKSYWKQDQSYLAKALPLLMISEEWLVTNRGYTIYDDELAGFLGIELHDGEWFLEHLWISPSKFGRRLGQNAIQFLKGLARENKIERVVFFPEPESEGFYLKTGARYTGRNVPSRIDGGPVFKEMEYWIAG